MVSIMNRRNTVGYFIGRNFLVFLSLAGIASAIWFTSAYGGDKSMPSRSLASPPISPFEHNISGIGFIEANSRNINIGAFSPGIVTQVLIKEGQEISVGDALFIQDQRTAIANLQKATDELRVAGSTVELAQAELADRNDSFRRASSLKSGVSVTEEEVTSKRFAALKAKLDLQVKENLVQQAQTQLHLAEIELEKTIIRSPINGLVLKVRIRPGEFISGNEQDSYAPVLIGSHKPLFIRVQIDENDLWRFDEKMAAYAYLRSNKDINSSLSFVRLEPFAGSKEQLRGTGRELIDTRIVEVIYKLDQDSSNLYIGQQMDVFIESSRSP